tara:strand:+ start:1456 stop:1647 length:192 start_codon:yes stop_codon:yes gene_type:complete
MIQTFKTDLEKALFMLQHDEIESDEMRGKLYVNLTEYTSVAIHPDDIEYLAERYDEYINELNQ